MRKSITLALLLWVCTLTAVVPSYVNPILPYDYSDPDVIRVGETYLMTSSSFNNVPGLQILTSRDLVHWQIEDAAIPHVLPGYQQGDKVLGNFVWAPSIREHDGLLYIFYGDPDRGIYCIRGKLHAWEEPVLVMPGKGLIDPCPLWDEDGRVWLVHSLAGSRAGLKSVLLMAELTGDALSVKTPSRIIFDGHAEHPTCEGPKLYKRNGYYYIMHPAGGVSTGWQVVQRSRSIYGPYELKITLQQGRTAINGPHQGAWVDTPEGKSWFVHFQDLGTAGRVVHMQPVQWVNDWPDMGRKGEPVSQMKGLKTKEKGPTWANFARRDEFDQPVLALDWQWAGGYIDPKWFFCDAANSTLRLYSAERNDELMPSMLLQKIPAVSFTATTRVRFMPCPNKKMEGAEKAGMIVFGRKVFTLEPSVTNEWTYLRLTMDDHQNGQFYTSSDGKKWTKTGDPFHADKGYWTGAQVGLFCTRSKSINDAGWLDVDWFEIETGNQR